MKYSDLRNKEKSIIMKNNYRYWKLDALDESGYFVIFQGFLEDDKLKKISGNALKLYIYLGINSSNFEGVIWHSNKKISKYFGKSERTIRGWMKELEDMNLIKRMRLEYNGNVFTYLQPYRYKLDYKAISEMNYIQGYLFLDEVGGIYIKGDHIIIPILRSMYIEIFNEVDNKWEKGKIQIRRYDSEIVNEEGIDKKIKYIFQTFDGLLSKNINKKDKLKARVYIE